MGGGQNNSAQAAQQNQAAVNSENANTALANQATKMQSTTYNNLFGADGKSGTLSPMMDPSNLNVASPTGAYKTAYNNASNTQAQAYNNQKGTLAQTWANQSSTNELPSGFQADQQRKLGQSQADSQGGLYAGTVAQQHQDALQNFWNANNLASGAAAQNLQSAQQANASAGQTAANVYGTAGAWHQSPTAQILGSTVGAAGNVGAAALCPAAGAKIRTKRGDVNVEELIAGDEILQPGGVWFALPNAPHASYATTVKATFELGGESIVSSSHEWILSEGGYVEALHAKGSRVLAHFAEQEVMSVEANAAHIVYIMPRGGRNAYLCDGVWSLA